MEEVRNLSGWWKEQGTGWEVLNPLSNVKSVTYPRNVILDSVPIAPQCCHSCVPAPEQCMAVWRGKGDTTVTSD